MFPLLFLLWIVLNNKLTWEIVITGVIFAGLLTAGARKLLGVKKSWDRLFFYNLPLLLRYVLVLIREIVKAAFAVMKVALTPSLGPDPALVEFHSGLDTDVANVLLANSITLTPGTYTLFQEGDHFVVHCLRKEYADGIEDSVFVKMLRKLRTQ